MELKTLLKNCRVLDGTGNPWYKADIGINEGRIVKIKRVIREDAEKTLDLSGLITSPGFIDPHAHSDGTLFIQRLAESALRQGMTTQAIGNCGTSPAPITDRNRNNILMGIAQANHVKPDEIEITWESMDEYLDVLRKGIGINAVPLVGHGTIRMGILGPEDEGGERTEISHFELKGMKELIRNAMEEGARGLSSGLTYPPGRNASTEELIELCKVVAGCGGFYFTHVRNEGDVVVEAYREAIRIAREAGIRVNIAHLKAWGRPNWGKVRKTLSMIEDARREGLEITCDVYPYPRAGVGNLGNSLMSYTEYEGLEEFIMDFTQADKFPKLKNHIEQNLESKRKADEVRRKELMAAGVSWPEFSVPSYHVIVYSKTHPEFLDMNLSEISLATGKDWITAAHDLLRDDGGVTRTSGFMTEEDVRMVIRQPFSMIGTDSASCEGIPKDPLVAVHPRIYGTYPRVLEKYVRKDNILTLPEAIRKMTSLPAQTLNLGDRGVIKIGMYADLVAFDPDKVVEMGTFANPAMYPKGIKYVIINGDIAVENETATGVLAGKVL